MRGHYWIGFWVFLRHVMVSPRCQELEDPGLVLETLEVVVVTKAKVTSLVCGSLPQVDPPVDEQLMMICWTMWHLCGSPQNHV
jgi:hypothetical protein